MHLASSWKLDHVLEEKTKKDYEHVIAKIVEVRDRKKQKKSRSRSKEETEAKRNGDAKDQKQNQK